MRAIDTNVLVRVITRDDLRQAASADAFIEGGAWVSILALAEAVWVLGTVYERNAPELALIIEMLLDHKSVVIQDAETVSAALMLFRMKPSLGFSDCLMVQLARKAGHLPLGTFDHSLSKTADAQGL